MTIREQIDQFLAAPAFGVIGASSDRQKFGNKVLRCYQQQGMRAIPVNPREQTIEGVACVAGVAELPAEVASISVITPPAVTEQVMAAAIARGIRNVWLQPGAGSPRAVQIATDAGINLIADGSCVLVVLGYHDH